MTDPVKILDEDLGEGFTTWLAEVGFLEDLPLHSMTNMPVLPVPYYWGLGMKTDPPPGQKVGYYLSVTRADALPTRKYAEVYVGERHPGFKQMQRPALALLEALKEVAHAR